MNKSKRPDLRRFSLDLDEDSLRRLNIHLRPGERSTLFRSIIDDILDLMDKVGPGLVMMGIINKTLRAEDYTRICINLRNIFNGMSKVNELSYPQAVSNISPTPRISPTNSKNSGREIQAPSKEDISEAIQAANERDKTIEKEWYTN